MNRESAAKAVSSRTVASVFPRAGSADVVRISADAGATVASVFPRADLCRCWGPRRRCRWCGALPSRRGGWDNASAPTRASDDTAPASKPSDESTYAKTRINAPNPTCAAGVTVQGVVRLVQVHKYFIQELLPNVRYLLKQFGLDEGGPCTAPHL